MILRVLKLFCIIAAGLGWLDSRTFAGILSGDISGWVDTAKFYADNRYAHYAHEVAIDKREESKIGGLELGDNSLANDATQIWGLELTDKSLTNCAVWGNKLTNVVAIRFESERVDPLPDMIAAATNFPRLEYLDFFVINANRMPKTVATLTNLINLKSLYVAGLSLTNIDSSIYNLSQLRELDFRVRKADFPDGISNLKHLVEMMISGKRAIQFGKLPNDLKDSTLEDLDIMNVSGIDERLPELPPNLIELDLGGCRLKHIPKAWLSHRKLQYVGITHCALTAFPTELLSIASLKVVNADLNEITEIPPLNIDDDHKIKITLHWNPIQHIASGNDSLIKQGILEAEMATNKPDTSTDHF